MTRTILILAAALALSACKGGAKHDRSTPEGTVRAFFAALDAGKIPAQLDQLFSDDHEVAVWQLRCKHRGCTGGTLHDLRVEKKYEYRAVVRISYEIRDGDGTSIMRGEAPVTLTREGKRWFIHQFGERRVIETSKRTPPDRDRPAAGGDGGL